jgi:cytochrome c6
MAFLATVASADIKKGGKVDGGLEFKEHCASCHPDGGNIVNPKKTLGKKALAGNGIKSAKDIIAKMRKPGPGMTTFDAKTIPDKEAKAIADYILKTFK